MSDSVRILGIDPGLRHTGWGMIESCGNHLRFVAAGTIDPVASLPMAARLALLAEGLRDVIARHYPDEAVVEETFVNGNARAALKLGQARGIALAAPALAGLPVAEYAANLIKKSVTGYGHADKQQVQAMMQILLSGADTVLAVDAIDALAIAVCHAHHRLTVELAQRVRA
ncbi:MAG: crossover junction endodeoxyribonuclease RuvC [Alphaproteobacteria bacterium]